VALFERLREGNILLQEVAYRRPRQPQFARTRPGYACGRLRVSHERRHLANGAATRGHWIDQLSVFNSKTSKALEDLGSLSGQFESHGKTLVDAAAIVEQSNRQHHLLRRRTQRRYWNRW